MQKCTTKLFLNNVVNILVTVTDLDDSAPWFTNEDRWDFRVFEIDQDASFKPGEIELTQRVTVADNDDNDGQEFTFTLE